MSSEDTDIQALVQRPNSPIYVEEYKPPFLPVLAIAFPILPLFWKYHVIIDEKSLTFGYSYGIVRKTTDRSAVIEAEPFDIKPLRQWGGWGLRMRLGKIQTGYIAKGGSGVKVTLKNESGKTSEYVFSCEEPEKVCSILMQK